VSQQTQELLKIQCSLQAQLMNKASPALVAI
jgi:hypothetical protein